jgi:hypothetical protein
LERTIESPAEWLSERFSRAFRAEISKDSILKAVNVASTSPSARTRARASLRISLPSRSLGVEPIFRAARLNYHLCDA